MKNNCVRIALGAVSLGASALVLACCSGPQPLDRAINPSDEQAYLGMLEDRVTGGTPRMAFLEAKAAGQGISIEEAVKRDLGLGVKKNPFDARTDQGAVSRGAVIYKHECMMCHGENADGHGPLMPAQPSDMDFHRFGMRFAVTVHHGAPKSWFQTILHGNTREVEGEDGGTMTLEMPAYEDQLAYEQIWLVITYLQSLDADLPKQPEEHQGAS
jgi:mono/diheme cytochrome c family protein